MTPEETKVLLARVHDAVNTQTHIVKLLQRALNLAKKNQNLLIAAREALAEKVG